ncbi:class I SAM-dependent methyltransferase [soil metagenome]
MISNIKTRLLKLVHRSLYRPGHYYSPIPDLKKIKQYENSIFDSCKKNIPGIDLNEEGQKDLLDQFTSFNQEFPFKNIPQQNPKLRYYIKNNFFNKSDAFYLFAFLRKFKPKRVIEVGSGYSSAVILDTNNIFLVNKVESTFIEPYPERLKSLLKRDDSNFTIIEKKVQYVNPHAFKILEKDDILFIDSSHISKVGSDLNYILFQILPVLKPGVPIHFHDICFPFEYPKEWVMNGIYWNEAYLLKSFLMFNNNFEFLIFNDFLAIHHHVWLAENINHAKDPGGSLWLRKTS